ncbi:MAG: acyl-CoA synthetase [Burkholderiaceae bacterium]|nr:MAG: acyl-CoA synthetase [Burkholderiaceae bacterium]
MTSFPLVTHTRMMDAVAWRRGALITLGRFLADVQRLAALYPTGRHVLNVCADRYHFTVGLAAAMVADRITLLPPTRTPEMVRQLQAFAPDVFCLSDGPTAIDLPQFAYPAAGPAPCGLPEAWPAPAEVPRIAADQTVAQVFTSGSTGVPLPHRKTWGALVRNMQAGAAGLGLDASTRYSIVGTVPPQHMYGFESTVLLALQSGSVFSAEHPFYPVDICSAIAALARPRLLVTTPVHLRALLAAGVEVPPLDLVVSATAPMPVQLAKAAEARLRAPLLEIYGSTETGQIATRRTAEVVPWTLLPQVRLVPQGERMWVSGGHVEVPVAMGDVLECVDDRHFLLHGRKADLVNIAGKRNSLAYLNHQLNAIAGVQDGAFFMPDEEPASAGVTRLLAFAVAPGLSLAALRAALRERIDPVFMPRPLRLVQQLPRNSTGKLPREALQTLAQACEAKERGRRGG